MSYGLDLLSDLVAIDTTSTEHRNYERMASFLKGRLKEIGAKTDVLYAKAPDGKPRPNVIGRIDNGAEDTVALNAHFDAMPVVMDEWKTDPFRLTVFGDRAFGRGTGDDKGNVAVAISAAREAKSKANLELIFTCDEEVGSKYGAKWLLERRKGSIKSNYAVVLDSQRRINVGASGTCSGLITVLGKEAHAGYPFLGKNAISTALPFLMKIQSFEKIANRHVSRYYGNEERKVYVRFNITVLNSGIKDNLLPGRLEAIFDMRTIPEMRMDGFMRTFQAYFEKIKKECKVDATLKYKSYREGYAANPNSKVARRLVEASGAKRVYASFGGNDGIFFNAAGIPVVAYGCGGNSNHKSNEYLNISDMVCVKNDLVKMLEGF